MVHRYWLLLHRMLLRRRWIELTKARAMRLAEGYRTEGHSRVMAQLGLGPLPNQTDHLLHLPLPVLPGCRRCCHRWWRTPCRSRCYSNQTRTIHQRSIHRLQDWRRIRRVHRKYYHRLPSHH
uniref:Putative secreted protein n=1 Tax=Anopheles triannulatus TaxID=58253 RepID=A0A2M4B5T7_9DIPT